MPIIMNTKSSSALYTMHITLEKKHLHYSHPSIQFGEAPNGTQSPSNGGPQGTQADDDDEPVVASERISTKRPITMIEMKDPVRSSKCPHAFER